MDLYNGDMMVIYEGFLSHGGTSKLSKIQQFQHWNNHGDLGIPQFEACASQFLVVKHQLISGSERCG